MQNFESERKEHLLFSRGSFKLMSGQTADVRFAVVPKCIPEIHML